MKILSIALLCIVTCGTLAPAWASVDVVTYMPISGDPVTPVFKFSKTVIVSYPNGGKIRDELNGKNSIISINENSSNNTSVKLLVDQLNTVIANERKSPVTITDLAVNYQVWIHGDDKQATLDYVLTLTPTITGYVMGKNTDDSTTVLDASWIGINLKDPVVIYSENYHDMEINHPVNVIKNVLPYVYDIIRDTDAEKLLDANLIDASMLFDTSLDKWDSLFDPAYTLSDSVGYGYSGQKVAVTGFAYGQSDLYQGSLKTQNKELDFTADSKYHLTVIDKASSGTINVQGRAAAYFIHGYPAFSTVPYANPNNTWCVGCLSPDQALLRSVLWISVIGAAVIGFWIFYFRRFKE
jgi:hypothetical protein